MKRYIRASYDSTLYNIIWFTQSGDQCGESCYVPDDEADPYSYIENYLVNTYGDEFGGIADYIPMSADGSVYSSTITRYSDVRPYEDRRYWYFTTHGIGPGTIPKDLTVLETREGQNDKGTWGTYVCLDGVLNTDELSYYDLRELAPTDY